MGSPTTTNIWDALQRLRRVDYPDGTSTINEYQNLDLVRVTDRMGFTTSYGYNSMRRKIAETNALLNYTLYNYCACGSLDSIQDAAGNFTYFYYDNTGRRVATVYPDGYSLTNNYNLVGQITSTVDSGGTSLASYFNNQGLQVAVSNAFGRVQSTAYDILDLATNTVDANGVSVDTSYDVLNRLAERRFPDGGVESFGYTLNVAGVTSYTNQLNQVTSYAYDSSNRKTAETNANLEVTQFGYSGAGDLLTLIDGKNQTTSWNYDVYGRQTNKVDAANNVVFIYQYDADNRLTNRWTPAKGDTAYSYDAVGNLLAIHYPISPAISFTYDAMNRLTNMVDAVGTTIYSYDAAGQVLSEDGPWSLDTVSYAYTNRLRTSLSVSQPSGSWTQAYGYDAVRRMTNTTSSAGAFHYHYSSTQPSTLTAQLDLPNGAYITNSYDGNSRLLSTVLKSSTNVVLNAHAYGYNVGNQRIVLTNTAGDYRNFTYDNIGQLQTAKGKEASGTDRLNEQYGYAYDAAHNLNFRTNNALVQTFDVNNLNELSTVTRSGTLTVAGTTTSPATNVTVNALAAAIYNDNTFALGGFSVFDGLNTFTAVAQDTYGRSDTNSITVTLPATNNFAYDLNGNLLTNGTEVLVYDDENELVTNWVPGSWKSEFVYDGKHRRRIQRDYTWNGSGWAQTNEVRFIYDGNVIVQHRDANNTPVLTLTRGRDLSGSLQGACGIGGLLAMTEGSGAHRYFHADGNGNVTCLISTNQFVVAKVEYDPYGNFISVSGPETAANVYWFSSKPIHWQSGKYDYMYRWYAPSLQRWVNRDPLRERGFIPIQSYLNYLQSVHDSSMATSSMQGFISQNHIKGEIQSLTRLGQLNDRPNLYGFVLNNAISYIDPLGLKLQICDCQKFLADALKNLREEASQDAKVGWIRGGLSVIAGGAVGVLNPPAGVIVGGAGIGYDLYGVGRDLGNRNERAQAIRRLYNLCVLKVTSVPGTE